MNRPSDGLMLITGIMNCYRFELLEQPTFCEHRIGHRIEHRIEHRLEIYSMRLDGSLTEAAPPRHEKAGPHRGFSTTTSRPIKKTCNQGQAL